MTICMCRSPSVLHMAIVSDNSALMASDILAPVKLLTE